MPTGAFIGHGEKTRWVVETAIARAAISPAVTGMTLGIVRQRSFDAQNGRKQAWRHAGDMVGAGLSGDLGWRFGMPGIFLPTAACGPLANVAVLSIPERTIDHRPACGLESDGAARGDGGGTEQFRALLAGRPMLIPAAARAETGAARC